MPGRQAALVTAVRLLASDYQQICTELADPALGSVAMAALAARLTRVGAHGVVAEGGARRLLQRLRLAQR